MVRRNGALQKVPRATLPTKPVYVPPAKVHYSPNVCPECSSAMKFVNGRDTCAVCGYIQGHA